MPQGQLTQAYYTIRLDDSAARIWLWHWRLRHSPFLLLQQRFLSLFSHKLVSKFQCETCELAKHYRASFSSSRTKSDAPFTHTTIWGPSRVVCIFY
jgi:hypothetical protein